VGSPTTTGASSTTGPLVEVDCSNPSFVDENLEEWVQNAAWLDPLSEVTRLTAEAEGIVSLSGIECLTGLVRLELRGNEVSDLGPLAGLEQLEQLDLEGVSENLCKLTWQVT
jgi:Leucine-rich repeat (LRR) protein